MSNIIQKYTNPWTKKPTKFNYNKKLFDVIADMTIEISNYLYNRYSLYNNISGLEIRDEVIAELTIDLFSQIKYWKPQFDLYSFVFLMVRAKFQKVLKLKKYKNLVFLYSLDEELVDNKFLVNYDKTSTYKTISEMSEMTEDQFNKFSTRKENKINAEAEDIKEISPLTYFYGE
jgi:hypothetical protein